MSYVPFIAAIYFAFALAELVARRFFQPRATDRDWLVDVVSATVLPGVIVPTILFVVDVGVDRFAPFARGALSGLPVWGFVGLFLVVDDLTQYAWHRLSHSHPALFAFHRAHHEARYMSVRVVYRNNIAYYALMPGLWLSAILVALGGGAVYFYYVIVKMAVIIGAHSSVHWDAPLYRHRFLAPLAFVVERVISTPATHAAHHGLSAEDGITHYRGNYGNLLFLWDVLFGTAKITRRYPVSYGIEGLAPASWGEQLLHPFVRVQADVADEGREAARRADRIA